MDFISRICVGFEFNSLPKHDQDYLYRMYTTIKHGKTCPKSFKEMDKYYPNRGNFKFFVDNDKLNNYINSSSKRNETYASHLLGGKKFWMVWTCDPYNPEEI